MSTGGERGREGRGEGVTLIHSGGCGQYGGCGYSLVLSFELFQDPVTIEQ